MDEDSPSLCPNDPSKSVPLDPITSSSGSKQAARPPQQPKTNGQTAQEKAEIEALRETFRERTRVIPENELIFDQEGLPFISTEDLETTARVLQLFYRYPQVAFPGTYKKDTFENHLLNILRSNGLRWLKPADAPSVRDILQLIKVQETSMVSSTGIRNQRNRKKRLLPKQSGQVFINHEVHEALLLTNTSQEQQSQLLTHHDTATTTTTDNNNNIDGNMVQKQVHIHGVEHYSTTSSLPQSAKVQSVDDISAHVQVDQFGHQVPLSALKTNFVPLQRGKDSSLSIAHPSDVQASLSKSKPSKPHTAPPDASPTTTQHVSKRMKVTSDNVSSESCSLTEGEELVGDSTKSDDQQPTTDAADKTVFRSDPSLFVRPIHPSTYTASNPQRSAPELQPKQPDESTRQTSTATAAQSHSRAPVSFGTVEICFDDDDDNDIADESATVPHSLAQQSRPNVDVSVVVGVSDDILNKELDHEAAALPAHPNSRFSTKTKQQQQNWTSKKGIYGGSTILPQNDDDNTDNDPKSLQEALDEQNQQSIAAASVYRDEHNQHQHPHDNENENSVTLPSDQNEDLYEETDVLQAINKVFGSQPRTLRNPIVCYICKSSFTKLHHFYDRMCPQCASFNYKKRYQTAPMILRRRDSHTNEIKTIHRICLVTGARVKIGYEIILKLLRAGAFVIGTSRFPIDTALRLSQEEDFEHWHNRVHIYGIDFRLLGAVEEFAQHILITYPRLDMIMNNAAQTIRRPPQFYRHLINVESQPLETFSPAIRAIVKDFIPQEEREQAKHFAMDILPRLGMDTSIVKDALMLTHVPQTTTTTSTQTNNDQATNESSSSSATATTADTTADNSMDDDISTTTTTPAATATTTTSPAPTTTTTQSPPSETAHSTSTAVTSLVANRARDELGSARFVTMLSMPQTIGLPAHLISQIPLLADDTVKAQDKELFPIGVYDKDHQQLDLRPTQTWVLKAEQVSTVEIAEVQLVNATTPFILATKLKPLMLRSGDPSWIINVSSMEGKFRGHKDITHPHTNMAKAALNMFTHTSSRDFAVDNIFMNAVDTGWVTEELPHGIAVNKAQIGFQPPLDEIDGASRCLDPVFTSLLTGVYEYGKFFKDYGEGQW